MTSLEQAIKDAVEKGGWKPSWFREDELPQFTYESGQFRLWIYWALLQPDFWQALGKARGWGMFGEFDNDYRKIKYEEWLHNWHRLIDHLASGKDVESFFATL